MNLLDDKYELDDYEMDCDCGEIISFTSPLIKGLITVQQCNKCHAKFFVENKLSKTRQGLHEHTIRLYNAVTKETAVYKHGRMTLRHLFYRLVSNGTLDKTEKQYDKLIKGATNMRKTGIISYDLFADGTRWQRKPRTYSGILQALENSIRFYRKSLWDNSDAYVEFWVEKDAISDIVYDVTSEYDVPLMIARGFSSLTFLHNSAEHIISTGKPAYIYHIGDYDPSGIAAANSIENTFKGFGVDITFKRLAITPFQIFDYDLPTRPTKESSHSKDFTGESVEVDAMEPHVLQQLVKDAILQHVDADELERLKGIETAEKETAKEYMANFGG